MSHLRLDTHDLTLKHVHIFCPNCGKHIDVSISEIEKLEGHYVCPQCLSEINLEGFEQHIENQSYLDDEELGQDNYAPKAEGESGEERNAPTSDAPVNPDGKATAQPPTYKPSQPQHRDDVMRYCKNCGTFLRQGVNFCPRCGSYVKIVAPPSYQGSKTPTNTRPPQYSRTRVANPQTQDPRNRVRPPMASSTRKPTKSPRKTDDKNQPKGIFSIAGCLTFTVIIVAIFFIVYILLGINSDGLTP